MEIDKIIKEIKNLKKAKPLVLLQFPEGLKKKATEVAEKIEEKTNAVCLIWMDSCYGACDTPVLGKFEEKIDLLVQFGHSRWKNE